MKHDDDDGDDERKDNDYVVQLKENNRFCLSINTQTEEIIW